MRALRAAVAAAILLPVAAFGQDPPVQGPPAPGTPPAGQPPPAAPAAPAASQPAPLAARTFTAPAGLLFNAVRADRVADFEKVIAYLQAALEKSTDPTVRAQARGWRIFKVGEPGPGGTVLYVFAFNPTVPGADYGLGRILADAYPDPAQLDEIWKLYQGAVTSGGSLLNLSPVAPQPAPAAAPADAPQVPAPSPPVTPPPAN